MSKLTVKNVERAKAGRHADGSGLYLLVSPLGSKSWLLRVQVRGRRRDIGLGSVAELTLAEARERCRELRKIAKQGLDPIAARDKTKAVTPTFEAAAEACHEARSSGWEKRHADAFMASLRAHAFPRLGRLLVDSIDERDILAVLSPLWQSRPAAARKLRQRIAVVLDFSKANGWRRDGAPRETLRPLLPKQVRSGHFAALAYADVPGFVRKLSSRPVSSGRLAVLFVVFTAARPGEVRHARWSQIDLQAKTWTRPATAMKTREEHVVTLSPAALSVLQKAKRLRSLSEADFVFPGMRGNALADMTLLKIVKAEAGAVTAHGFRAAFRTWAAEKMPTMPEAVAESALAHRVRDEVVRAYQRARFMELRRKLLDAWGEYALGQRREVQLADAA